MAAIDDVARALGHTHASYRSGMEAFAEHTPEERPAVRAAPELYGDLAFHYVDWVVQLARAMVAAAEGRPDAPPGLQATLERCAAYVARPDRWPAVRRLEGSPRFLIPAYYITCALQLVNARLTPSLLAVNFDDPLEFVADVVGRPAAHAVREQKNSDLRDLLVPAGAAPEGARPRAFKRFLSADRKRRLTQARAAALAAAAPAPPAPVTSPAPPARDPAAEARARWRRRLEGCRLTFAPDSMRDRDYSRGGYYHASERFLELHAGGRYRSIEQGVSRVSSGGLTVGGPFRHEATGTWDVRGEGASIELVLRESSGDERRYDLADRGGAIALDGQGCGVEAL
jgi:hypothetical protein